MKTWHQLRIESDARSKSQANEERKALWISAGYALVLGTLLVIAIFSCSGCSYYKDAEFKRVTWYQAKEGTPTASGEPYSAYAETCAAKDLPFGSKVMIVIPRGFRRGCVVIVTVNDRCKEDVIDLTPASFHKIAPLAAGEVICKVMVHENLP